MRAPALAGLLMLFVFGRPVAAAEPAASRPPLRLQLTDDVIRQAVRATLAEGAATPENHGRVLSGGDRYASFGRQMDEARTPSCLHPDALKHQPAQVGPIGLGGILALPFWGAAILRGKCEP